MRTASALLAIALALAGWGCQESRTASDGGIDGDGAVDDRPAAICKPGTFGFSAPAFEEKTVEAHLAEDGIDATAFVMSLADLDGDGYEDLVAIGSSGVGRGKQRVYFNRPDPDQPGRRIFEEATDTGIDQNRRSGVEGRAAAFHSPGDVDNDGDLDLFAGMYVGEYLGREGYEDVVLDRQEILLNDGSGHFSLVAGGSSVAAIDPPADTDAVLFDYDRDGVLDLYVGGWYTDYPYIVPCQQDVLYRGNGDGTFSPVTEQAGLEQTDSYGTHDDRKPTYGVSHCDIDSDGDQDILQASYGRQWNDLFWNRGDGTFVNIGESSGYDGDELVDFTDAQGYLCYCRERPGACPPDTPNPVAGFDCTTFGWSQPEEPPFRLNGSTFGVYCGDVDGDLDMDVLEINIAHGRDGASADRSGLWLNDGQRGQALTFTWLPPAESGIGEEHQGIWWDEGHVFGGMFDYDNDGDLDLLIGAGAYPDEVLLLYRNDGQHRFREVGQVEGLAKLNTHSPVFCDYDLDGDLDVLTGASAGSRFPYDKNHLFLFENHKGELNNATRIRLRGAGPPDGANSFGIGAIVEVTSGDLTQVRQIKSGEGRYGSQSKWAAVFGFAHRCDDLEIKVTWPDRAKTVQHWSGVRANYEIVLTEGEEEVDYVRPLVSP